MLQSCKAQTLAKNQKRLAWEKMGNQLKHHPMHTAFNWFSATQPHLQGLMMDIICLPHKEVHQAVTLSHIFTYLMSGNES